MSCIEKLNLNYLGAFFAELGDDADGDFLAFAGDFDRMGMVVINPVEGFVVDFDFEGFFGVAFGGCFRQRFQSFFPLIEFAFIATAEEDLPDDEVVAVVVCVHHPVGDVSRVA